MKKLFEFIKETRSFLLLWLTQSFSALGSGMTSYALVIWSYTQSGSALRTALLMVSSYAPYVLLSIFAGALSDRWNKKKTMLICDSVAALTTIAVLILMLSGGLRLWHLYAVNIINGLMNTFQQPASEVAVTRLLPEKHYQRVGALRYLANSVNSILTPVIATAFMSLLGIGAVIGFDLATFAAAFITLLLFIRLPEGAEPKTEREPLSQSVKAGTGWLKENRGIFMLILFLAGINLVASAYQAALPAMVLPREGGGEAALGTVNTVVGIGALVGSILASAMKKPKNRVNTICFTLLFTMSFENFLLAFGRNPLVWSIGGFLGWVMVPIMSTNLDAVLRLKIPADMQGRIYSVRNSLQFFTIPVGYLVGGALVDSVFEPLMQKQTADSLLVTLFGSGKGSGAAALFFILGVFGIAVCLYFIFNRHIRNLAREEVGCPDRQNG